MAEKSGGLNEEQEQAITRFIDSFDSVEAAIQGLKEYLPIIRPDIRAKPKKPYVPPSDTILLATHNLRKTYKRGRQKIEVLKGVDLSIYEGEFVAITGASGSGKSTLLQLMGGLDKPTSGDVMYGNTSLAKLSDAKLSAFRRQAVGFVFQFFYLQPFLKLSQNLEVPTMFARTKRKPRRERLTQLATTVGLEDRLTHLPKELSGGQMQRAAIARALMNQPKILLADEPTGNLDSANSAAIINLFEAIRSEFGTTIVIVTHDPSIAARADREIVMKDGVLA
ncbi:MAG: ABC transporter ATP-binding protein [Candidatus Microsaccharimonas sp.]